MNPTNPSSDSASTGTTAAEQFLAAELAAKRLPDLAALRARFG